MTPRLEKRTGSQLGKKMEEPSTIITLTIITISKVMNVVTIITLLTMTIMTVIAVSTTVQLLR